MPREVGSDHKSLDVFQVTRLFASKPLVHQGSRNVTIVDDNRDAYVVPSSRDHYGALYRVCNYPEGLDGICHNVAVRLQ